MPQTFHAPSHPATADFRSGRSRQSRSPPSQCTPATSSTPPSRPTPAAISSMHTCTSIPATPNTLQISQCIAPPVKSPLSPTHMPATFHSQPARTPVESSRPAWLSAQSSTPTVPASPLATTLLAAIHIPPLFFPFASKFSLEHAESPLQFPLLPRLFASLQKFPTPPRRLFRSQQIPRTRRLNSSKLIRLHPQTLSWQKRMFYSRPYHRLQLPILESIRLHRPHILMRQINP